jgi:hypothetical protein
MILGFVIGKPNFQKPENPTQKVTDEVVDKRNGCWSGQ